ncbi:hypothetical protein [Lentzea sp. NPDC059081]
MRAFIATALLVAAVLAAPGTGTGDRAHILGSDADTSSKREHIL